MHHFFFCSSTRRTEVLPRDADRTRQGRSLSGPSLASGQGATRTSSPPFSFADLKASFCYTFAISIRHGMVKGYAAPKTNP